MRILRVRRWKDGSTLGDVPGMPEIEQKYGAPQYVVYRPELLNTFVTGAMAIPNVELRLGFHVKDVNFDETTVTGVNGETLKGDVIIAADGVRSTCRANLFKYWGVEEDKPKITGEEAYRVIVPAEKMLSDPDLSYLITESIGYATSVCFYGCLNAVFATLDLAHMWLCTL
jgi:salicylate hydroxylase